MISEEHRQDFRATVWDYYHAHGRHDLPWRQPRIDGSYDPYAIMVSELMLQQTQVTRVIPKYRDFLERFPTISALAAAPLGDVLRAWSGLGYNRRAKFLHQAARQVTEQHQGHFPETVSELTELPGIGPNTAAAIVVYTHDRPEVFLETNIRTVYIHHFFHDQADVPDRTIREYVSGTLDHEHPREWYWALMDYGSHLKQTVGNLSRYSAAYNKQSKFEGSLRQVRGQVIRLLADGPEPAVNLRRQIRDERLDTVIQDLLQEGLIQEQKDMLSL